LTCPGLVDEFVLDHWDTTCPVYLTTGECVSPCGLVELLPGVTTCECPEVSFAVDPDQEIGGDIAKEANYATFRSSSLLSIVYSINVEIYPELEYVVPEYTLSPSATPPDSVREIIRRPVRRDAWYLLPLIIGLCCLFVMLLFLCCRPPKKDYWLEINNSYPCLRSAVVIYDEKFLDSNQVSPLCALVSSVTVPHLLPPYLSLSLLRARILLNICLRRPIHSGKRTTDFTMMRATVTNPPSALPLPFPPRLSFRCNLVSLIFLTPIVP
jgi:hypothetical protein